MTSDTKLKIMGLPNLLKIGKLIGTLLLCFFLSSGLNRGPIVIPNELSFSGILLKIEPGVQRQIDTQVALLERKRAVFESHLPEIQGFLSALIPVLDKYQIPRDFQYLALNRLFFSNNPYRQNGFWQLPEHLSKELSLVENEEVDERYHIILCSEVVSKYLATNNHYFQNWFFNALSLKLGYEKTRQYVRERYQLSNMINAQEWRVDESTHPYLRNLIALKIFMTRLIEVQEPGNELRVYRKSKYRSIKQVARRHDLKSEIIALYNPWLKAKRIPRNKLYPMLIPIGSSSSKPSKQYPKDSKPRERLKEDEFYPPIEASTGEDSFKPIPSKSQIRIQPDYHQVLAGQSLYQIARMYSISVQELRDYNKLNLDEYLYPGQELRITPPNTPPQDIQHQVEVGESLFSISKKYKVSPLDIKKWNFLRDDALRAGQILNIYFTKVKILQSNGQKAPNFNEKYGPRNLNQKISEGAQPKRGISSSSNKMKPIKLQNSRFKTKK